MGIQQCTVLVAEDDHASLVLTLEVLRLAGCHAFTATSGTQALKTAQEQPVDLVLMDVHMPEMTGIEATRALRQWERSCGRPKLLVVGVTASAMPSELQACIDAGMDSILVKPINVEDLLRLAQDACSKRGFAQSRSGLSGWRGEA